LSHDFWSIWDFVAPGSGTQSHQVLVFPGRPVATSSGISQGLMICLFTSSSIAAPPPGGWCDFSEVDENDQKL
jgi:hypothetical protein